MATIRYKAKTARATETVREGVFGVAGQSNGQLLLTISTRRLTTHDYELTLTVDEVETLAGYFVRRAYRKRRLWTPEQVAKLNEWQACPWVHPFTCGGDRGDAAHRAYAAEHGGDFGQLFATVDGWICPVCDYRQTWAHRFMFSGAPPDPPPGILLASDGNGERG